MSRPITPTLVVAAAPLLDALTAVLPAAARDDKRPILSSVLFEVGTARKPSLKLVACDNYRIAQAEVPMDPLNTDATIRGAVTTFVLRLADAGWLVANLKSAAKMLHPVPVTITWLASREVEVSINGTASGRFTPIDGHYPNYAAVLPKGKVLATIAVSATYLAEMVRAMAPGKPGDKRGPSDTVLIEVRKATGTSPYAPHQAYLIRPYRSDAVKMAVLMPVRTHENRA